MDKVLEDLAARLRERDGIEARIAELTGTSARQGDVGEFIASRIFDIELAVNPVQAGHDGHFRSGRNVDGGTVNVKTYGSLTAGIDISAHGCDYYLVLSGSPRPTGPVRHHRWQLISVYLFDAHQLVAELVRRTVKIGTATSLRAADIASAQIYPVEGSEPVLHLSDEQRSMLSLFA